MPKMSESTHRYVDDKLRFAIEGLEAARGRAGAIADSTSFDGAMRILAECRTAAREDGEIDLIAGHLRAASRVLGRFRIGVAAKSVSAAIDLIDQALGGATI